MQHPMLCMYRRGPIVTRGGKELTVIGSIKSGAWHPKWRLVVSAFLPL